MPATPPDRPSPAARLTSVDHKDVGRLFVAASLVFLVGGGVIGGLLRLDTSMADSNLGDGAVFAQMLSFHSASMVFLFLLPAWLGLALYLVPLQIGARGLAFPRMAALSFWTWLIGGLVLAFSYAIDEGASTGVPVDVGLVQRSDGTDLMLVGLIAVCGAFVAVAVNLLVTVARLRAPGLTLWHAPAFTWSAVASSVLLLLATPVYVAGLALLYVSVHHGGRVFDPGDGDFAVLWQHLLWFWGNPQIWALVIPAFGVVSEVIPVFGRRPLPNHRALVAAFSGAATLAFGMWAFEVHTLRGKPLLPIHSVPAALVLAPLGVIVLLWLATLARGRPSLASAPLFATGMLLTIAAAVPLGAILVLASDVPLEATQFLAGHVHLFLFAPATFGLFAGLFYWAPKLWGRHLSEAAGRLQFLLLLAGTFLAFVPMYVAGLEEMPIRAATTDGGEDSWEVLTLLSTVGTAVIVVSVLVFVANVLSSVVAKRGRAAEADPWQGDTLEWAADSPPVADNFRWLPDVRSARPLADWRDAPAPADADTGGNGDGDSPAPEPVAVGAG